MDPLYLRIEAPFAAFRPFTVGSFRPTADFLTPSAAYGLLLHLAGIEMRDTSILDVMTHIKTGLPRLRLALGQVQPPRHHVLFQQLHNYPVGNTGKEHKPRTMGCKYNIAPVKRAFLSNLKACLAVQALPDFLEAVRNGVAGQGPPRYGLPFLGDNSFLPDRIEFLDRPLPARWYERLDSESDEDPPRGVTRLTITIDRADSSRSLSALFAPGNRPSDIIPDQAWVEVGY